MVEGEGGRVNYWIGTGLGFSKSFSKQFSKQCCTSHKIASIILALTPDPILLYRDALMLVINKPSGIPVHPGSNKSASLEDHFEALRFGLPQRPNLAHRLDRDTSGCLILGRHRQALARLGRLFAEGKIEKTYLALCQGVPAKAKGRVDAPLRKQSTRKDKWWMEVHKDGQFSRTDYEVLNTHADMSLIRFFPKTGRTHQIRVHAAHIGCPLWGDKAYHPNGGDGFFLHASTITVPLHDKKPPVIVEAPLPEAFVKALHDFTLE